MLTSSPADEWKRKKGKCATHRRLAQDTTRRNCGIYYIATSCTPASTFYRVMLGCFSCFILPQIKKSLSCMRCWSINVFMPAEHFIIIISLPRDIKLEGSSRHKKEHSCAAQCVTRAFIILLDIESRTTRRLTHNSRPYRSLA
jgi:hypothetical protein